MGSRSGAPFSERDNLQAGDKAEVFRIQSGDIEAQVQSSRSDDQILDGDRNPDCGLLALDAAGKLGNGERDGMHYEIAEDLIAKKATAFAVGNGSGPVDAMRQFHCADSGQGHIELSMDCSCLTKDVSDRFAASFAGDEDTRVEDQSHAEVSRGLRLRMISSMSAANSASITGS